MNQMDTHSSDDWEILYVPTDREMVEVVVRGDLASLRDKTAMGGNVNAVAPDGSEMEKYSLLHIACMRGHRDVVEHLVVAGANVNYVSTFENRDERTPLMTAGFFTSDIEILRYLVEAGADVNFIGCDGKGHSILMRLCHIFCFSFEAIKYLISAGANVHYVCQYGDNALSLVCRHEDAEHIKLSKYLIDCGVKRIRCPYHVKWGVDDIAPQVQEYLDSRNAPRISLASCARIFSFV